MGFKLNTWTNVKHTQVVDAPTVHIECGIDAAGELVSRGQRRELEGAANFGRR